MPPSPSRPKDKALDEDMMDITSHPPTEQHIANPPSTSENRSNLALILRDTPNWLSNIRSLREADVVILLTPVVVPIRQDSSDLGDPFEPFGRSLASRHARIRHVPYTQRNGITSTHLGFIKRGQIIILCFAPHSNQDVEIELVDILFAVTDNKPCIIVVCCKPADEPRDLPFPTVIQTSGYSPQALEATAALIFGESSSDQPDQPSRWPPVDPRSPGPWTVELWNESRDISKVLSLWTECMDERFEIDERTLGSLLRRPGYAKHYVIRDTKNGDILGFAATYLSYVDQEGEKLIASLAMILVRLSHRKQGIGSSLYHYAMMELKKTRGVIRLQLGTTFPRILYGPLAGRNEAAEWLQRRGWQVDRSIPGEGLLVHDLILNLGDWYYPTRSTVSSTLKFRPCSQEDMGEVLPLVGKHSITQSRMGWYDQYLSLMNGPNVKDAVIAIDSNVIVGVALTYTPSCGSQVASNLPWAALLGNDVGGTTCVCIRTSPISLIEILTLVKSSKCSCKRIFD